MKRAVSIQALLEWAYAVERVGASGGAVGLLEAERRAAGYGVAGRSMTGALADQAALGARVSGGGGLNHCHDDAELVDRVVGRMLSAVERGLVVAHASARSAPDWMPSARHRLEPVKIYAHAATDRWRPEVVTTHPGRRGAVAAYCSLVERDAPETVARARAAYTTWREALYVVHGGLTMGGTGLTAYALLPVFPPDRPWTAISPLTGK